MGIKTTKNKTTLFPKNSYKNGGGTPKPTPEQLAELARKQMLEIVAADSYVRRLVNFYPKEDIESVRQSRVSNITNTPIKYIDFSIAPTQAMYTYGNDVLGQPKNAQIEIYKDAKDNITTYLHELVHASTMNNSGLNKGELDFIKSRVKTPAYGNERDWYLTGGPEVLARKVVVAKWAADKGIVDINSDVDEETFNVIGKALKGAKDKQSKEVLRHYNELLEATGNNTKNIIDIWNTVAQVGVNNENLTPIARDGGWPIKAQNGTSTSGENSLFKQAKDFHLKSIKSPLYREKVRDSIIREGFYKGKDVDLITDAYLKGREDLVNTVKDDGESLLYTGAYAGYNKHGHKLAFSPGETNLPNYLHEVSHASTEGDEGFLEGDTLFVEENSPNKGINPKEVKSQRDVVAFYADKYKLIDINKKVTSNDIIKIQQHLENNKDADPAFKQEFYRLVEDLSEQGEDNYENVAKVWNAIATTSNKNNMGVYAAKNGGNLTMKKAKYQQGGAPTDIPGLDWLKSWINAPEFKNRLTSNLQNVFSKNDPSEVNTDLHIAQILNYLDNTTHHTGDSGFRDITSKLNVSYPSDYKKSDGLYGGNKSLSHVWSRDNSPSVNVHEYTHATRLDSKLLPILPESAFNKKVLEKAGLSPNVMIDRNPRWTKRSAYNDAGDEIEGAESDIIDAVEKLGINYDDYKYMEGTQEVYPEIMRIRYDNSIKPGQIVDDKLIEEIFEKEKGNKRSLFNFYDKEQVRDMLNTLASSSTKNTNGIYAAKNGGTPQTYNMKKAKYKQGGAPNTLYINGLPDAQLGGLFRKIGKGIKSVVKGVGNVAHDWGIAAADSFGNRLGIYDIDNSKYRTGFGQSVAGFNDKLQSTTGKIGSAVASTVVPGLGSVSQLGSLFGYGAGKDGEEYVDPTTQNPQTSPLNSLQMLALGSQFSQLFDLQMREQDEISNKKMRVQDFPTTTASYAPVGFAQEGGGSNIRGITPQIPTLQLPPSLKSLQSGLPPEMPKKAREMVIGSAKKEVFEINKMSTLDELNAVRLKGIERYDEETTKAQQRFRDKLKRDGYGDVEIEEVLELIYTGVEPNEDGTLSTYFLDDRETISALKNSTGVLLPNYKQYVKDIIGVEESHAMFQNKVSNAMEVIKEQQLPEVPTEQVPSKVQKPKREYKFYEQGGNPEQQMLGYKDNSPYKNRASQKFYTDTITMDGVGKTLLATSDNGISKILKPNSGIHTFPGASVVTEVPIPMAQDGGRTTQQDSVAHQANKILKYEQLKGGPGGAPLPSYSDPRYFTMLMQDILPEVDRIMPNASAMEKAEAMDFIFNAGYDKTSKKIIKDPRAYAIQEYYRKYDPSKLDKDGKWSGRKGAAYSFDEEYNTTIGKLPENERRVLMNRGRDWYYQNIQNPAPGVYSPNYEDTWYGRIWNTNDYNEFDPNATKLVHPNKRKPQKRVNGGPSSPLPFLPPAVRVDSFDEKLKSLIKKHEGSVTDKQGKHVAYPDSLGYQTIGYGHLMRGVEAPVMSQSAVDDLFNKDYLTHKSWAQKMPGFNNFSDSQKAAIIDMTFNLGDGWWEEFPRFTKALNQGDTNKAAQELRSSLWAKQVGPRADEVINLLQNKGNFQQGGKPAIAVPPRDKRIKSYQDSLNLHNLSSKLFRDLGVKRNPEKLSSKEAKEDALRLSALSDFSEKNDRLNNVIIDLSKRTGILPTQTIGEEDFITNLFKKPSQPYVAIVDRPKVQINPLPAQSQYIEIDNTPEMSMSIAQRKNFLRGGETIKPWDGVPNLDVVFEKRDGQLVPAFIQNKIGQRLPWGEKPTKDFQYPGSFVHGGTPEYQQGGAPQQGQYRVNDEDEMIEGIIEILTQIEDLNNRQEAALQQLEKLRNEGIEIDEEDFMAEVMGEDDENITTDDIDEDSYEVEDEVEEMREGGMPERYRKMGFSGVNKPKRTPGHGSKSHAVVVKDGSNYKLIRFGQKGVSGSPKKSGESEAYANRRKSFKARHAANIAKGKTSAAYWSNLVKWSDGGLTNSLSSNYTPNNNNEITKLLGMNKYENGGKVMQNYMPVGNGKTKVHGFINLASMIPIQAEKKEMIVLETGDLVPVNAKRRHSQMSDDEVTDIVPENSYILSQFGSVDIYKSEADQIQMEMENKPYNMYGSNPTPKVKTLGDIMRKKVMKPADLARLVEQKYKIMDHDDPFTIQTNAINKHRRGDYLQAIIQLSEYDKARKGIDNSIETQLSQNNQQPPQMVASNGGKVLKAGYNVPKADGGLSALLYAAPAIIGGINSLFSGIGASKERKRVNRVGTGYLNQYDAQVKGLYGNKLGAELAGFALQDPNVEFAKKGTGYLDAAYRGVPQQAFMAQRNYLAGANQDLSQLTPQQAMLYAGQNYARTAEAMNTFGSQMALYNAGLQKERGITFQNVRDFNNAQDVNRRNALTGNVNANLAGATGALSGYYTNLANLAGDVTNSRMALLTSDAQWKMNNMQNNANNAMGVASLGLQGHNSYQNAQALAASSAQQNTTAPQTISQPIGSNFPAVGGVTGNAGGIQLNGLPQGKYAYPNIPQSMCAASGGTWYPQFGCVK